MEYPLATSEPNNREKLTAKEKRELAKWEKSKDYAPLSLEISLGLYELFLNGHSFEEIVRVSNLQGRSFTVGMVADAALRYDWFTKREDHQQTLYNGIVAKTRGIQAESVSFIGDMLAAAHKLHGDKLKEFLVTGDPNLLAGRTGVLISSLKEYRDVIALLMTVTGQHQSGSGGGTQVNVNVTDGSQVKSIESKQFKPSDVHDLLKLIDDGEK